MNCKLLPLPHPHLLEKTVHFATFFFKIKTNWSSTCGLLNTDLYSPSLREVQFPKKS